LEITRICGRDLTKTMIKSFELFLTPGPHNDEILTRVTYQVWSQVFYIHLKVEEIGTRFQNLLGLEIADSNDDDLLRVLNLLLNLVQRKQRESPERARKLMDRISDLRNVLD